MNIKRKLLKLIADAESYQKEIKRINDHPDWSIEKKEKEKEKFKQEFTEKTESEFNNLKEGLTKEGSSIKGKLQEMQSGDYDKRQYQYNKAVNELSNYDDIDNYLSDKLTGSDDEIAKQEARKAALSKAKAKDPALYEQLKESVAANLPDDERELRTDLAKVDIKRQNLSGAESAYYHDLQNNDVELMRETVTSYADNSGIDEKAAKKVADTID